MNKRGMGTLSMMFLLMILTLLLAVQQGVKNGAEFEALKSAYIGAVENVSNHVSNVSVVFENPILNRSIAPFIKISLKYTTEMFKIGTGLALDLYEAYPQYINPEFLIWLFIISLCAPLIIPVVKLIIIAFLLIKEFFDSRKEKRLEGGKNDVYKK